MASNHAVLPIETDLSVEPEADTLPSLRANCWDREVFVQIS